MAKIEDHTLGAAIEVSGLAPGQLGKVVANGGIMHNGSIVVGVAPTILGRDMPDVEKMMKMICAVNLETGELVTNPNTMVVPYAKDVVICLK